MLELRMMMNRRSLTHRTWMLKTRAIVRKHDGDNWSGDSGGGMKCQNCDAPLDATGNCSRRDCEWAAPSNCAEHLQGCPSNWLGDKARCDCHKIEEDAFWRTF